MELRLSRNREEEREALLQEFHAKAIAAGLGKGDLRKILRQLLVFQVPAGRLVTAPGETPDFVYVVGSGCIKIVVTPPILDPPRTDRETGPRIIAQFARPSFVFGLNPVGKGRPSTQFGAVAHVDSTVVAMSREVMCDVLERTRPEGRLSMVAYHTRALSRMIYEKCRLLAFSVRDRLRLELQQLARSFPDPEVPGRINLPLSHQDLAELIGASRFAVMRTLLQLGEEVEVRRNQYVISPELDRLEMGLPTARAIPVPQRPADDLRHRKFARRLSSWAQDRVQLPPRVIESLVEGAKLFSYEPGERIGGAGDPSEARVLISGAARVMVDAGSGGSVGAWIAKPGHFIGVGPAGPRADYAQAFWSVALTRCDVAVLSPKTMVEVLGKLEADELLTFLGVVHDALSRQLYDRCVMLALSNTERLLYQLHRLAVDFPDPVPRGLRIDLPIRPRRDLAPLVVVDPTGVSRALTALQAAGHVLVQSDGSLVLRTAAES